MTTVFLNGTIHTMDPDNPHPEWVAVDGDRISGVGSGSPPAGDVFDLAGRTLFPGFQDAHNHAPWGGLDELSCNLHPLKNTDQFAQAVAEYAAANPDREWITGGGWSMAQVPDGIARADVLDAVVPDRPVYLGAAEGHAGWANTLAMELAGITDDTPDPANGVIERDPDGRANGMLQESAAFIVEAIVPKPTDDEYTAAILHAQQYLHSLGITGWQDAWVEPRNHEMYKSVAADGRLTAHVMGALWWDRARGVDQLDEHFARSREAVGRYRPHAIKLMVDGVCENGSAWVRDPFEGTDTTGMAFIPAEILIEIVPKIMAAGLQPHFHAIGDAAIRDALDAVAAADPADIPTTRPHIAHVQVLHDDDLPRFAELDVTVNAQTLWACDDKMMRNLTAPRLGPERTHWQYKWRSLLDSGARMACGSDWSVSTPNVFAQVAIAVNRAYGDVPTFMPEERITPYEALHGFTVGSAYVMHRDTAGMLREGFDADLAVANADPLVEKDIHLIEVDATFVAGDQVWLR